ncbi:MAG: hypothetical protein U0103_00790 [Candidatus Obscuribacterales bacterium]|nr:hypothetical protein [Cyanobacteria bacterium SZAS LIN-5]
MPTDLKTVVTFKTSKFNTTEHKSYFINPTCFGDDTCNWLIAKLSADGITCAKEPGQEDFGWYFTFQVNGKEYCFVCGFREGEDNNPGEWAGWIERSTGFFEALIGGRNKNIDPLAISAIDQALRSEPAISDVKWYSKHDFDRGLES